MKDITSKSDPRWRIDDFEKIIDEVERAKEIGDRSVKYKCKDNDAEIIVHLLDGKIDELHIGIQGSGSWTVIGYKDLQSALKKAMK